MAAGGYFLVWDMREVGHPHGPHLTKAEYASLKEAEAQRDVDLEGGRQPLRIEDAKGAVVWEP